MEKNSASCIKIPNFDLPDSKETCDINKPIISSQVSYHLLEVQNTCTNMSGQLDNFKKGRQLAPLTYHYSYREFICGWGAAFVNICVTFPINKVMFRQQLHGMRSVKAIVQLKNEGLRHLYRGLLPPLLQKTTSMSIMFGSYYRCQDFLQKEFPTLWLPANRASAALIAGVLEASLTPFERIQVLMQDQNYQHRFTNTMHAFRELKVYGIREYYRGMTAILLRNGPSNIPFFLIRDHVQENWPKPETASQRVAQDFFCGALLGAAISTVFYPLNVVKVKMQSQLAGDFLSLQEAFRLVLNERNNNVWKLFRGVHLNFTRSFISWGIVNATYEWLMRNLFSKHSSLLGDDD